MSPGQGEFSLIVVKRGRLPGSLAMATLTGSGKIGCFVVRICSPIVICRMAAEAGLRCRSIVNSMVAGRTIIGYGRMRSGNHIIFTVIGKTRRSPTGSSGMASRTIGGQGQCLMVRTRGGIEVCRMAIHTFGGCTGVSLAMAFNTIY